MQTTLQNVQIRPIKPEDNKALAHVIRKTLEEFGANKPGTVYYDGSTDHLSDVFQMAGSIYFVAEVDGRVVGGGGIYPSPGLPEGTCELVKMYLLPEARGIGLGSALIQKKPGLCTGSRLPAGVPGNDAGAKASFEDV